MNRKGQAITLDNAPNILMTLIVIGMFLGTGLIALGSLRDTEATIASLEDTNSTFTTINATAVEFAVSEHPNRITCTVSAILNGTNTADITSSFTITDCTALLTDNTIDDTVVTVAYNFTENVFSDAHFAINTTMRGPVNLSAQLPTVGIIIGVALMLAIVIGIFVFLARP